MAKPKSLPQARKEQKAAKTRETQQIHQNGAATTRLEAKKQKPKGSDIADSVKHNPPKKEPDWKAIEVDYRAGIKPLRLIAAEHGNGISHVAINKRANRDGWERDLSERIKAKAEALVNKDAVNSQVTKADEKSIVEANAQLQADVIRAHRTDIGEARNMVKSLMAELGASALSPEAIEILADWHVSLTSNDESNTLNDKRKEKLFETIMKSLDMPVRIGSMQKLTDSLVKLVTIERTVFGIDKEAGVEGIEDRLKRLEHDHG